MENNGARIYGMMLSAFCSLMLGSTLISAHAGYSMAAVGASFGEKVSNEVMTAGWAVPAPSENALPKMGAVKTVSLSAPSTEGELEPIVRKVESEGRNASIDPVTAKLLGFSTDQSILMKAKAVKLNTRLRAVGVFSRDNSTYVYIVDRDADQGYVYLTGPDGRMTRGLYMSKGSEPKPLNPNDPDFAAQKTYWKTQLANTSVASVFGS